MFKHKKKDLYCVVLTGATGGIARSMINLLLPHSQYLILVGHKRPELANMPGNSVQPVHWVYGDIAEASTRAEICQLAQSMGGINLLINNAGINAFVSFPHQDPPDIQKIIDVNLTAPMLLTRELLPLLHEHGQIVNIGSTLGTIAYPGFTAYCASKFGLRGFTQALRRELADTTLSVRYFSPRATQTTLNSEAVIRMNAELQTPVDSPGYVAELFMKFLKGKQAEYQVGTAEKRYAWLSQLMPGLFDKALLQQLPVIQKYLRY